jgi:hypothetical protein
MTTNVHVPTKELLFQRRFLILLITLLLWMALYPFLEQQASERLVSFFFTGTLVTATYAVSRRPRFLVAALVFAAGAFSTQWLSHFMDSRLVFAFARSCAFLFFMLITGAILLNVLKGERVNADKIFGAICAYLAMGLTWAFLFALIEVVHPGSFLEAGKLIAPERGTLHQFALMNSMVYYSLATLTTTTYGDILPKTTPARALSNLEAVAGQMYVAVVISRLVALQITHSVHSHSKE